MQSWNLPGIGELNQLIDQLHQDSLDTIGDRFHMLAVDMNKEGAVYVLTAKTELWMRNEFGALHGGITAAIADQAMGFVAALVKLRPQLSPTIHMDISYLQPLIPGNEVSIRVKVLFISSNLITLNCEIFQENNSAVCASAEATYFCVAPVGTDRR